jgi:acetoacetate decarboxylase
MNIDDIRHTAYAMPLTNPSFPRGPYRFFDREYLIVTYRTDPQALRAVVGMPLEITEPLVKYEFIRMPDSTGFGDYTESGQVIPVRYAGQEGLLCPLDVPGQRSRADRRRTRKPGLSEETGAAQNHARRRCNRGHIALRAVPLCALATFGYKHRAADKQETLRALRTPNFVLKIIPHVDGARPRICELVRYRLEDIQVKESWSVPAELQLFRHVFADVARLPVP